MGHEIKGRVLIIEKILKQSAGKISIGHILSYLENFTDAELEANDLVHKQWVLDQLAEIDTSNLFQGYFADEAGLIAYTTDPLLIPEGAWALVGTATTFAHYDWDLDAQAWKVITGEKGDPGTVDLGALDLRYLRKDVDDENPNTVTFGKLILSNTDVEDSDYEYYLGVKADNTVVKITPATVEGDKTRYFEITPAGSIWVLDHGMGKRPGYTARDSAGNQIFGKPDWPTLNQMTLTFVGAVAGDVSLN